MVFFIIFIMGALVVAAYLLMPLVVSIFSPNTYSSSQMFTENLIMPFNFESNKTSSNYSPLRNFWIDYIMTYKVY